MNPVARRAIEKYLTPVFEHYRELRGGDIDERIRNGESWSDIGRQTFGPTPEKPRDFVAWVKKRFPKMSVRRLEAMARCRFDDGPGKSTIHEWITHVPTRIRGVHKVGRRWRAMYRRKHLGYFSDPVEAAAAYDAVSETPNRLDELDEETRQRVIRNTRGDA